MKNSKFIQINPSVLLEYIYSDETHNKFNKAEVPIYKYKNTLFNGIKNEIRNSYHTGNSINRIFETRSDNKISLLRAKSIDENVFFNKWK